MFVRISKEHAHIAEDTIVNFRVLTDIALPTKEKLTLEAWASGAKMKIIFRDWDSAKKYNELILKVLMAEALS